ncbi:lipid kinase [Listeria fleischmannii FSL S10-1203]|uniref:Lipid kinase n=1 Tax=Listeria fleischmannii FSL S10-1203 TaxID=1265822 RepID=W7DKX5_9LIST|nr:hypothetical protein [Listeria fleischmannii]EUJ52747.1 lipid kinase [Listeria fleischmannii FSL S10-1203]
MKNVKLESRDDLNISYDGVYGGLAPYELGILANALQVFASKETLRSLQKKEKINNGLNLRSVKRFQKIIRYFYGKIITNLLL